MRDLGWYDAEPLWTSRCGAAKSIKARGVGLPGKVGRLGDELGQRREASKRRCDRLHERGADRVSLAEANAGEEIFVLEAIDQRVFGAVIYENILCGKQ